MSISTFVHKRAGVLRVTALAAALCISGIFVAQASYSVNDTVSNEGNSWSSAEKEFDLNGDRATTMFNVKNIKFGDTDTQYITLTQKGTKSGKVKMYFTGVDDLSTLNRYILLYISVGHFDDSHNFVANDTKLVNLATAQKFSHDYASGIEPGDIAQGESVTYQIKYVVYPSDGEKELPADATSTANFVWQVK